MNRITDRVIGAAITVHRELGPGLLESSYQRCMALAAKALAPIFDAQLLTYLRLSGCHVGLIINFHKKIVTNGFRRLVL